MSSNLDLITSLTLTASSILGCFYLQQRAKQAPMKLYYFDIPGKGEAIRLACAYGNLPLDDVRLTYEDFLRLKNDGVLAFGQVPALAVDDKTVLIQSASIMRYIGRKAGLYPLNDPIYAAFIDSIVDQEIDLFTGLAVSKYRERFGFGCLDDATVAIVRKSLNDDVLPRHLNFFENLLEKSKTGWIAGGEKPSIADFVLVPRLQWLVSGVIEGISVDLLKDFPHIQGLIDKFLALPSIVQFYATKVPHK